MQTIEEMRAHEQGQRLRLLEEKNLHGYTVAELIEKLKDCNQEAHVVIGGAFLSVVTQVADVDEEGHYPDVVHLYSELP
mgnify:CR=1 FL=1